MSSTFFYSEFSNRMIQYYKRTNRILTILLVLFILLSIFLGVTTIQLLSENDKLTKELELVNRAYDALESRYFSIVKEHQDEIVNIETKYMDILHMTTDWQELVNTVKAESGGEGADGIKHVTSTVINRVHTGHWGPTIHDVLSAPGQFSAYGKTYTYISPELIAAVDDVLVNGVINDAIYYMNPRYSDSASRSWMRTKPYLLTHKNHEFYGS